MPFFLAASVSGQDLGNQEIAPRPAVTVNSVVSGNQNKVDLALAPNDDMVLVWRQGSLDVAARRLSVDGTLTPAADFVVNSNTDLTKDDPAVCVDAAGNAVIAWAELDAAASTDRDIRFRRFDNSFAPLTGEQVANEHTTGSQRQPDVTCLANGDFLVVWGGESASDTDGVVGRRFASDGTAIGGEIQINTDMSGGFNAAPGVHLASQDDGDFVVAWAQSVELRAAGFGPTTGRVVSARRFSGDGVALDAMQFEVASADYVYKIGLDKDGSGGDFVVSWNDSSNFGRDIEVQRYDSSGVPMGSTVFANISFSSSNPTSAAFAGPSGEIVVAWSPSDSTGPKAQRLDASMQPIGSTFVLDDGGLGNEATVEGKANGELAVAYTEFVPSQQRDVFAKRFIQALFADGFESGDTTEWFLTEP